MRVKNISIIGLGLIGGSIAKALQKSKFDFVISAFDKPEVLSKAFDENIIHSKLNSYQDSLNSDLIFLCLPVAKSLEVFDNIAPKLSKDTILTDVCSVKNVFKEKWDKIKSNGIYIGGHPMTGKEKGGFDNSDSLLFENSVYILTENENDNPLFADLQKIITSFGSNILHIPAQQHDIIAASVSHLPQLVSVALVNAASLKTDSYNFLDLAAGGFRDMTRIASSDFKIWESIIANNKNHILTALDKFSYDLSLLSKQINNDNYKAIEAYFENARIHRDEVPQQTKGFLHPLFDLFVFVTDEPGAISKISTALFNASINIKDMELLKIREGSGGTFRLSFESSEVVEKASIILKNIGFETA
ncbi:MAG: prephenate dehydrogenase/arogenate dehydrogenase family protein [Bacteroidetes bacterium]|nr:prephenate dehydrogenase/arogenate dehydrogenase family protein [Bacteroidota bacterium]MBU1115272.1 prephenate dehydrogenase/arogenate dehydrogenase family protein [Bacteroidota bacterium]MBU1798601.1 prephenate dehydrogenase/arogenate dehydrogenase family protein [Bacteroidota bacterium]